MQQQLLACDSENKANKEFYLPWFHRRTSTSPLSSPVPPPSLLLFPPLPFVHSASFPLYHLPPPDPLSPSSGRTSTYFSVRFTKSHTPPSSRPLSRSLRSYHSHFSIPFYTRPQKGSRNRGSKSGLLISKPVSSSETRPPQEIPSFLPHRSLSLFFLPWVSFPHSLLLLHDTQQTTFHPTPLPSNGSFSNSPSSSERSCNLCPARDRASLKQRWPFAPDPPPPSIPGSRSCPFVSCRSSGYLLN